MINVTSLAAFLVTKYQKVSLVPGVKKNAKNRKLKIQK